MSEIDDHFPAATKNDGGFVIHTQYSGDFMYDTGDNDLEKPKQEVEKDAPPKETS